MVKELFICVIIIISIFSLDIFTQHYTETSMNTIIEQLSNLKIDILEENKENIKNKVEKIDSDWKNVHDKLAYYIEHDELEKVDTAIVTMKSYIETKDFSSAIAELEEGKFILEHIEEKNSFNLENIF